MKFVFTLLVISFAFSAFSAFSAFAELTSNDETTIKSFYGTYQGVLATVNGQPTNASCIVKIDEPIFTSNDNDLKFTADGMSIVVASKTFFHYVDQKTSEIYNRFTDSKYDGDNGSMANLDVNQDGSMDKISILHVRSIFTGSRDTKFKACLHLKKIE